MCSSRFMLCLAWFMLFIITQIDRSLALEQSRVERLKKILRSKRNEPPILELDDYYSYEGMLEYLDELANAHKQRVVLRDVGFSYEKRPLKSITITNGDGRAGKKVIFLVGGEHAREWLSHVVALYAISELVVNFERNAHLLENHDWIVMPQVNPDGYIYSRSIDRMWRNTRSPNGNNCFGTNINRNYALGWRLGYPELNNPCDESYAGSAPFSESETRAVRDIMHDLANSERALMYLSLHSRHRSVVYPWVYKKEPTDDDRYLKEIAKIGAEAMQMVAGTKYSYEQPDDQFGGTSLDYAYSIGFPLSYVIELTGERNGEYFDFWPPRNLLKDLAIESWAGIKAMAEKATEYSSLKKSASAAAAAAAGSIIISSN